MSNSSVAIAYILESLITKTSVTAILISVKDSVSANTAAKSTLCSASVAVVDSVPLSG